MACIKKISSIAAERIRAFTLWLGGVGCRVSFFMTIALLLVSVLVGAFFYVMGKKAVDTEIRERALYVARYIATLTVNDIITQDPYEIYQKIIPAFLSLDDANFDRDILYIYVYNSKGDLLVGRTQKEIITPVGVQKGSAPGKVDADMGRRLPTEVLELAIPSFTPAESGVYHLTYPVVISGSKVGFIKLGLAGRFYTEGFTSLTRKGILALLSVFLLGFVFSQIIAIGITRPISRLTDAVEDLGRQSWRSPLPMTGTDEISRLARSFNQLARTLKQREASLSQANRDLFILHAAGLDLMESLETEDLFAKIAARTEDLVRADTVAVSRVDPVDKVLKYIGVFGGKASELKGLGMAFEAGGIYNWAASYGTPLLILHAQNDFRIDPDEAERLGIRCIMAVPLWSSNRMTGLITAINKKGGMCFDKHDLRLFTVYSGLVSAALQNSTLFENLRKSMEDLRAAQEQVVRSTKLAAIGELAANVAHEINNPLTSVLGYASHLLRLPDLPEHPKKLLKIMEQETLRVRRIIRNLLDFARQRPSWMRPFDLLQPLRETVALVQGVAESSSIRIHEEYDGAPVLVKMEPNEIKQVFINIVNNAMQAMPDGGSLTIRQRTNGRNEAYVEFIDTGVGIPEENKGKIFEPFFSTKGEGSGTGLGLSISYRIVHNHGGRIEVESEPGSGSTFRVVLPLHEAAAGDALD